MWFNFQHVRRSILREIEVSLTKSLLFVLITYKQIQMIHRILKLIRIQRHVKKQKSLLISQNCQFHITKRSKIKIGSQLPTGNKTVNLKKELLWLRVLKLFICRISHETS